MDSWHVGRYCQELEAVARENTTYLGDGDEKHSQGIEWFVKRGNVGGTRFLVVNDRGHVEQRLSKYVPILRREQRRWTLVAPSPFFTSASLVWRRGKKTLELARTRESIDSTCGEDCAWRHGFLRLWRCLVGRKNRGTACEKNKGSFLE